MKKNPKTPPGVRARARTAIKKVKAKATIARRNRKYTISQKKKTLNMLDRLMGQLHASLARGPEPLIIPYGAPCPDYPHMHGPIINNMPPPPPGTTIRHPVSSPIPLPPSMLPGGLNMGQLEDLALLRMLTILKITSKSLMEFYGPQVLETLTAQGLPPVIDVIPGVAVMLGQDMRTEVKVKQ